MNKTDKIWLAGFVDGEGYIGLEKRINFHTCINPYYFIRLLITQKDKEILNYIRKEIDGGSVSTNGVCWQFAITNRLAYNLLKQLLPYLKVKKLQAQVAIQFYENKTQSNPLTKNELAWRELYYITLRYLKKQKWD